MCCSTPSKLQGHWGECAQVRLHDQVKVGQVNLHRDRKKRKLSLWLRKQTETQTLNPLVTASMKLKFMFNPPWLQVKVDAQLLMRQHVVESSRVPNGSNENATEASSSLHFLAILCFSLHFNFKLSSFVGKFIVATLLLITLLIQPLHISLVAFDKVYALKTTRVC